MTKTSTKKTSTDTELVRSPALPHDHNLDNMYLSLVITLLICSGTCDEQFAAARALERMLGPIWFCALTAGVERLVPPICTGWAWGPALAGSCWFVPVFLRVRDIFQPLAMPRRNRQ